MTKFNEHWRARLAYDLATIYVANLEAARPEIDAAFAAGKAEEAVDIACRALRAADPAVIAEFEARLLEGWTPSVTH